MKKGVALRYDGGTPFILSVAESYLLNKMLAIAERNNIPVYEDKNLAELLSRLPVGAAIPEDLFEAVVKVFAFCYGINERFRNKMDLLKK